MVLLFPCFVHMLTQTVDTLQEPEHVELTIIDSKDPKTGGEKQPAANNIRAQVSSCRNAFLFHFRLCSPVFHQVF